MDSKQWHTLSSGTVVEAGAEADPGGQGSLQLPTFNVPTHHWDLMDRLYILLSFSAPLTLIYILI